LFGSLERTRTQTDVGQLSKHIGAFLAIIAFGIIGLSLRRGLAWRRLAYADPTLVTALLIGLGAISFARLGSESWSSTALIIGVIVALLAAAGNAVWLAKHDVWRTIAAVVAALGGLAAVALALSSRETLALGIAFAAVGGVFWLVGESIAARFTGALIAAGASIVAGIEVVFLADDLVTDPVWYRMNTVFKFYNQVWTLLAIAAAVLLTSMIHRYMATSSDSVVGIVDPANRLSGDHEAELTTSHATQEIRDRIGLATTVERRWLQIGLVASVLVIGGSLAFPVLSTAPRLQLRFPDHAGIGTLNALDWMRTGTIARADGTGEIDFSGDLAAIDWFNENVDGTPVIAEASIGPYRGNGSRISIATGLPTILGWDRHERQQRYADGINTRFADVRTLYDSTSTGVKLQILQKYDVQYVIVGDVERYSVIGNVPYASADGIAEFDTMVGHGLEIAFQSGTTTVYRVTQPDSST
jgi:uncharacterized membrane protein